MSDEIKEIINNPKILMLSYGNYISLDDYVKLKDYITNLQEELETTNKKWGQDKMFCENRLIEILELKEEIKSLKKNQRYYKNGIFSLEYDKETLNDMVDDYKSRVEKAIKYIKEHNCIATNKEYKPTQFEYCCNADLLNILNGDEGGD